MANCNKCKSNRCGCGDSALSIPATFSNCPTVCPPNSEKCTELFDMACICYNGPDIVEYDIKKGSRLDEVIQKLILAISSPGCATFQDPTTCESPINLTVSNLTSNSFEISWDTVTSATGYSVEYKEVSSLIWLVTPVINAPLTGGTIVGLLADTIYDIRINAICPLGTCYSLNIRIKTLV
jgi:hypothetical protein